MCLTIKAPKGYKDLFKDIPADADWCQEDFDAIVDAKLTVHANGKYDVSGVLQGRDGDVLASFFIYFDGEKLWKSTSYTA